MVTGTFVKLKTQFGFWAALSIASLLVMLILALNFAIISAFVWIICWAFSIEFMFHYVIGVWVSFTLIKFLLGK